MLGGGFGNKIRPIGPIRLYGPYPNSLYVRGFYLAELGPWMAHHHQRHLGGHVELVPALDRTIPGLARTRNGPGPVPDPILALGRTRPGPGQWDP